MSYSEERELKFKQKKLEREQLLQKQQEKKSTDKTTQSVQKTTSQQVRNAKSQHDGAQTRLKDAKSRYESFLNQQTNADQIDFLQDGSAPAERRQLERKILWQNYQKAQADADEKKKAYDDLLNRYTNQLINAEKNSYQQMELNELNKQKEQQKTVVDQKQAAAIRAQNDYGLYMNEKMAADFDFLEGNFPSENDTAQQKAKLHSAYSATDELTRSRERQQLMEDTYNYRYDMQIISGMSEADKLVLALYGSRKDPISFINTLTPQQRKQLRNTGKYQQLIENPGAYLKQSNFGKEDLDRLAESYSRYLNEQRMASIQERAEEFAEEHPFLSTVSTYPAEFVGKVSSGLTAIGSGIEHTLGLSHYHGIDVNKPGYAPSVYSDTTRSKVSEDFNDTQKLAYNGVNTAVDEIISNAAFKGMSMLPGLDKVDETGKRIFDTVGAYGDTTYNTAVNGATTNESIAASTANAGLNWLTSGIDTEKIAGEKNWESWDMATQKSWRGLEKMVQEDVNSIGDWLIQNAILDENHSFWQQVNALVQTGVSEEDAKKTVYKQYRREMENDLAWLFISALVEDPE